MKYLEIKLQCPLEIYPNIFKEEVLQTTDGEEMYCCA